LKIENSIFNFTGIGQRAQNLGLGSSYFAFVEIIFPASALGGGFSFLKSILENPLFIC